MNEYDELLARRKAKHLESSLAVAIRRNPDEEAKLQDLSRATGLPVEAVRLSTPETEYLARQKQIDANRIAQQSKVLGGWLTDPANADIAHDDVESLGALETGIRAVRTLGTLPFDVTSASFGLLETGAGAAADFIDWGAGGQRHANPFRAVQDFASTYRKGQAWRADQVAGPQGGGLVERSILSGIRSFAQMVPGTAASIATGNPAWMMGSAGFMSGSQSATAALDKGVPAWRAAMIGATDAEIEVLTEMAPALKFVESIKAGDSFAKFLAKQMMTEIPGEMAATLGQSFNAWAGGTNGDQTFGEYVSTLPEQEAETVIATMTMTLLTAGLGRGVVRVLDKQQQSEQAKQHSAAVKQLMSLAKATKLAARSPKSMADLANQMAGNEVLYVDSDVLMQSAREMPPGELERVLPSAAAQLRAGVPEGTPISIPLGEVLAGVPGTALEETIVQNARQSPDAPSAVEAEAAAKESADMMAKESERIAKEAEDTIAWQASVDAVKQNLMAQLEATGRYTADASEAYATALSNTFAVLADRTGMTPEEMYARYPLRIRAEGQAADMLDASTPPAPPSAPAQAPEAPRAFAVADERLQDADFRRRIEFAVASGLQSVADGNMALVQDPNFVRGESDKGGEVPLIHSRSTNPQWWQKLAASEGVSVDYARNAVRKLVAGKKLGEQQQRIVQGILDAMTEEDIAYYIEQAYDAGIPVERVRALDPGDETQGAEYVRRLRAEIDAAQQVGRAGDGSVQGVGSQEGGQGGDQPAQSGGDLEAVTDDDLAAEADYLDGIFSGSTRGSSELFQSAWQARQTNSDAFKRWSNDAPLVTADEASGYPFKSGKKVVVEGFHGTKRPDRVGTKFLKKRATSGPMAFFTSSPDLASSYATSKQDTSLAYEDGDYSTWFKVKVPGARKPVDLVRAWHSLPQEVKDSLAERLPDIRTDDDGNVLYEEGGGDIGAYAWNLKETQRGWDKRGNPLKAAVETWLNSGALFNQEEQFMEVLRLAGMPMADVTYDAPTAEYPFVYRVYVAMNSPLVTNDIPGSVIEALKAAAKKDRTRPKRGASDIWDKQNRTLREWVANLTDPNNTSAAYVWTSIPDKVTDVFRSLGYDGIIDESGKGGGTVHPVYIPFEETQVKSAIGNNGRFDRTKNDILKQSANQGARDKLRALVDAVGSATNENQVVAIGPVPQWEVAEARERAGLNIAGFSHAVDLYAVRHTLNQHGDEAKEASRGQIAVTSADIELIPDAVLFPDAVIYGAKNNRGQDLIASIRVLDDGSLLVVEEVRTGQRSLALASVRKVPAARDFDSVARTLLSNARSDGGTDLIVVRHKEFRQAGDEAPRGTFSPSQLLIVLKEGADLSTVLHEGAHFYLEVLADLASQPGAPQQIADDVQTFLSWSGVPDLATWQAMDLEGKRPHHEKWAEAFEAYLFEGKAPNAEIQGVFRRFRAWMVHTYKSLKQFLAGKGFEVSPEIRAVFDRLVATDEQIRAAEERAGMVPDDEATSQAIEELDAKSLRDLKWSRDARGKALRKLQREAQDARKKVYAEVRAEVEASPVEQARAFLRDSNRMSPEDKDALKRWKERREAERERAAEAARKAILADPALADATPFQRMRAVSSARRQVTNQADAAVLEWETANPRPVAKLPEVQMDAVADRFGFSSGDHLQIALKETPPAKEQIERLAEQRMLERHGELTDAEAMERAADEAVHNEARARAIAAELTAQEKALGEREVVGTNAAGRRMTRNVLLHAAKQFAAQTVAMKKVIDLKRATQQHRAAEAKAAQKAGASTKKAKTAEAIQARKDQLLHNQLVAALLEAQTEVDGLVRYLKKFDREGIRAKVDPEYLQQIDALLEAVDLRKSTSGADIARRQSMQAWIEEQKAQGLDPILDADMLEQLRRTSFKEMTVEQLRGLTDAVANIEHLGRVKHRLLTAQKQAAFEATVAEISNSIADNAKGEIAQPFETPTEGVLSWWKKFKAEHRKLASLWRQMDGGNEHGILWNTLGRGMQERGTDEAVRIEKATEEMLRLMKPILALPGGFEGGKVYIRSLGTSVSRQGRIAVMLNAGNATNRQRLDDGNGVGEAQIEEIARTLSPAELQFVNDVWEYIDSFWPEVKAKQERVSGVAEKKVEAVPFEVTAADGSRVRMRGGYYPLKYDATRNDRASAQQAAQVAEEMKRGAFTRATTRRGHTKARVDTLKRAVRLDLGVIPAHVNEVVHDLVWHEWLIDANRLMSAEAITTTIRAHYGHEVLAVIKDSLDGIATGDVQTMTSVDNAMQFLRNNISRSVMGFSMTTALLQPFGVLQSIPRIGAANVLRGFKRWAGNPLGAYAQISEKSEFMRLRQKTMNRELFEIQNKLKAKSKAAEVLDTGLFLAMRKMQALADIPTWFGEYEKVLAETGDEAEAVAQADRAVLESQGGGQTKDLAPVQRHHPMLSMFYSYFNATLQLAVEKTGETNFRNPRAVAGWISDMALLFVASALGPALVLAMARGDDNEPEDLAKKLAQAQASYLLGMLVGVRELSGVVSGYDYSGPPVGRAVADIGKAGQQTAQGEVDEALVLSYIRLLGSLFGLPVTQLIRSYRGWQAWENGDAGPGAILLGPPPKD
jgi:hypothetical protein